MAGWLLQGWEVTVHKRRTNPLSLLVLIDDSEWNTLWQKNYLSKSSELGWPLNLDGLVRETPTYNILIVIWFACKFTFDK